MHRSLIVADINLCQLHQPHYIATHHAERSYEPMERSRIPRNGTIIKQTFSHESQHQ